MAPGITGGCSWLCAATPRPLRGLLLLAEEEWRHAGTGWRTGVEPQKDASADLAALGGGR